MNDRDRRTASVDTLLSGGLAPIGPRRVPSDIIKTPVHRATFIATGCYYRVLQQGLVDPGDGSVPIDRPSPEWTRDCLHHLFYLDLLNLDELREIAALPHLAESWCSHARRRIATRRVEDRAPRLSGMSTSLPDLGMA